MKPKVSIIIPTYNDERYIKRALESILFQSFLDFEIIIIDDGSTDNTKEVLKSYIKDGVIKYIFQNNSGITIARNKGIKIAKGDYIAFLDSDDEWIDKDKIKKQIEFLDNNLAYVLVGTGVINIDKNGKEISRYFMPETDLKIRQKLLRINCFICSSVVLRKEALGRVGLSESLLEDYDLWLRLGLGGKLMNLKEYSVKYFLKLNGVNTKKKGIRLKENLYLSKKYKNQYPGYRKAFLLGILKMIFYPIFSLFPAELNGIILKIHKRF